VTGKERLKNKRRIMKWPSILDCDIETADMERLLQVDLASLSKAIVAKKRRTGMHNESGYEVEDEDDY
jgi:hypothetical protein